MLKPRDNKDSFYTFDDENKEIVFHRHDMPSPWMNYLTNETFFTMISQAGGNLSWYKSPEIWRIGRYGFFLTPTDVQGLFIYIKDKQTGKVWNPSVIPTNTPLDFFESRHGRGYSKYIGKKDGVSVSVIAFVGKENALTYRLKVVSDHPADLEIYVAKEMGNMEYLREMQWQCYTKQSNNIFYNKETDALVYDYFIDAQARPLETPYVFLTSTLKSDSYTAIRKDFLGAYRDLSNPEAIEKGGCPNSELLGGEGIFAFSYKLSLKKGEEKDFAIVLGTMGKKEDIPSTIHRFKDLSYLDELYEGVLKKWQKVDETFHVSTNDKELDRMANIWTPYQAYVNFLVCREISFYATGTVRGFGVRDASQDSISQVLVRPERVKERIKEIMSEQFQCGKTTHRFFHIEKKKSDISDRSDDHLWMIYTVDQILKETGDDAFLNEKVPYYDGGEGTVLEHLEVSIRHTHEHMGKDDIPLMLGSDWNDNLNTVCRKGKGQSVMVAEQYVLALKIMAKIEKRLGKPSSFYEELAQKETKILNETMFEKDHYIRAITDSGVRIGGEKEPCARVWINSNAWAVLAGVSDNTRANLVMDTVMKNCDSPFGLVIQNPPLRPNYPSKEEEISWATPGIGENGGVFCHANTWSIIALCLLNRADEAYHVYSELLPDHIISKIGVDAYNAEPYIYSSNVRAPFALRGGEAAVSWLTGTATWMDIALKEYFFGIRPMEEGLYIDPTLPSHINNARITRKYRGCVYEIEILFKGKKSKPCELYVDGKKIGGNIVPAKGDTLHIQCIVS